MNGDSILWRRLDLPGHDSARLARDHRDWRLTGAAVFAYDDRPCRLDYTVVCDQTWRTLSARVAGWFGDEIIAIDLTADASHGWRLNGTEVPAARGCVDVDLAFTPATNLLPIRRLTLAVGAEAPVRAAPRVRRHRYFDADYADTGGLAPTRSEYPARNELDFLI